MTKRKNFKISIVGLIGLLCLLTLQVFGQEGYVLDGKVTSPGRDNLGDISISIEGVQRDPVITDSTGIFRIQVPGGNVWILVSPVDRFKPKRVFLNNRKELIINLVPRDYISQYDDINLIFGEDVKRNITGAAVTLRQRHSISANLSVDEGFQGRVSGMKVLENSGMPGSGAFMVNRGLSGLFTNQQPLIIIDGILYENFGTFESIIDGYDFHPLIGLDPNDIVSITVLKDPTYLATYGSKAGNGAIVMETLKPTETRTTINVSAYTGFRSEPSKLPVLNSSNYRTLAQDVLQTSGQGEENFIDNYPGLFDDPYSDSYYRYNHETQWQEQIYRRGLINGVYMNVRGGDEIGKYGLSVGFADAKGTIKSTSLNRFSIRFVGSLNVFEWLKMFVSTNLNYTRADILETGKEDNTSPIFSSLFKAPFMAPYQYSEDGQRLLYLDDVDVFNVSNPAAIIENVDGLNNSYRFVGSFRFQGDITEHLRWNSIVGLNLNTMKESIFLPDLGMVNYLSDEARNLANHKSDYLFSMQFDNNIGYEKRFSEIQLFKAYAGFRVFTNHLESDIGISGNTPSDEYTSLRYGASGLRYIEGDIGNWNWLSYYGNAEYSLLNRYFLHFNIAMDGSSRVGKYADMPVRLYDRPFGVYPSASIAWRISDERFLRSQNWLEELKIRFSYGVTGNDDIGNYNSRSFYEQVLYRETTGLVLGFIPNQGLMSETYRQTNLGMDLSLWGERFFLSSNLYMYSTSDLFILQKQPGFTGYDYQPVNNGSITNKGIDLHLSTRILDYKNFSWEVVINSFYNQNRVESIQNDKVVTEIPGGQIVTTPGHAVNSFYGLVAEGIYSTTEQAQNDNLRNGVGIPFMAGDVEFRDISGPEGQPDGIINEHDRVPIGDPNPDFFGGFHTSIKYKRFSLFVGFQFSYGNEIFNYVRYQLEKMSNLDNQSTSTLRRWTYEGQETDIPRAYWNDLHGNNEFSTRWIEDGSYLKLNNITFSYTIPEKFLTFQNASFYITAKNLFTITNYLGYDPEFSYSPKPYLQGIDYGIYPNTESFILGIKFGL